MEIRPFDRANEEFRSELAGLLAEVFPHSYAGCAVQEADELLSPDRIAMAAVNEEHLIGFAGAIPQYGLTGWELHPIAVLYDYRGQGIGSRLISALEHEIAARGGITVYLGTDDEFDATSLSGEDLYIDTFAKIENIRNLRRHPYEFYQKMGYKIVGIIPDANGYGKPDIFMAKRVSAGNRPAPVPDCFLSS